MSIKVTFTIENITTARLWTVKWARLRVGTGFMSVIVVLDDFLTSGRFKGTVDWFGNFGFENVGAGKTTSVVVGEDMLKEEGRLGSRSIPRTLAGPTAAALTMYNEP